MRIVSAIIGLLLICASVSAQQPKSCGGLDSLAGEWVGAGTGAPGEGAGGFTFQRELQGKVLVRRNFAEYPPMNSRPAYRHDDLMVIYGDANASRADYWDNESHVIRYAVTTSPDGCTITFESSRSATEAAFKLTYTIKSPDEVSIGFQIAPPGKDFGNYITASAKRKK
jgi:hypothetical protein